MTETHVCACCGQPANSYQAKEPVQGKWILCSLCEDVLFDLRSLKAGTVKHLLARACEANATVCTEKLGCTSAAHYSAMHRIMEGSTFGKELLFRVAKWAVKVGVLPVPDGFEAPADPPAGGEAPSLSTIAEPPAAPDSCDATAPPEPHVDVPAARLEKIMTVEPIKPGLDLMIERAQKVAAEKEEASRDRFARLGIALLDGRLDAGAEVDLDTVLAIFQYGQAVGRVAGLHMAREAA